MRTYRIAAFAVAVLGAQLGSSVVEAGEWELTGVIGALSGGDVNALIDSDVRRSFENSRLFGGRLTWAGTPVGVEVSFVTSPSGLSGNVFLPPEIPIGDLEIEGRVHYGEFNVLLIPIPGPVSPVLTAGIGIHAFDFEVGGFLGTSVTKTGYNFGAGVKVNLSHVTFRADVRDHVTAFGLDDFGGGALGDLIGLDVSAYVHNVEIALGVGIRF
jgi:hypothetical protein